MTDPAPESRPNPRARDLLLAVEVAALIVAGVLIVAWVTDLVPALRDAISLEPLIIVALVLVTVLVLARALWPRR
ncbi:MAG: hypothetical protein A2146_07945 [Actinobacteria bacterium RBG_16_67_10]|nr:MAG: hypothetical protein A2146_07945 [Actinobacteria bacterium RBG_16_67_10]